MKEYSNFLYWQSLISYLLSTMFLNVPKKKCEGFKSGDLAYHNTDPPLSW